MGTLQDRARRIHTLGNLTLLTAKLNKAVSNGPWDGKNGKRSELRKHDLLLLNRDLDGFSGNGWADESIMRRTGELINKIIDIWRVPPRYKSSTVRDATASMHSVDLSDFLSPGSGISESEPRRSSPMDGSMSTDTCSIRPPARDTTFAGKRRMVGASGSSIP